MSTTDEFSIKADGLSKKFARSMKRAMWYGLVDIGKAALIPHRFRSDGLESRLVDAAKGDTEQLLPSDHGFPMIGPDDDLRASEFWALRNVTFEVKRGESLGLIGPNGAGKSTLFSILSGIYGPTHGRVQVNGHLQALIALGAGFHPMLSGRENVYINAAVLGLRQKQIDAIIDEIIDFSEIGDFIDMPVKRYSSGMLVRLGFSVAVHMKPDILLVDEVLSVGDMAFRNKSFQKMMSLLNSGITLLFVSHWPQAVEMVCTKAMWLDHGGVRMIGETSDVVTAYTEEVDVDQGKHYNYDEQQLSELFPIKITSVETLDMEGNPSDDFGWKQSFVVRFKYQCAYALEHPYFHFRVRRPGAEHRDVAMFCMHDDDIQWNFEPGSGVVECVIQHPNLAPGPYELRCAILKSPTILTGQGAYQDVFRGKRFAVKASREEIGRPGRLHSFITNLPPMLIEHEWRRPS